MAIIVRTFDLRGERLCIVLDETPTNPLDMTDAPFNVENYTSQRVYWRNHETRAERPTAPRFSRDTGMLALYFDADGNECEYFNASGALYVDKEEWLAYAGAVPKLAMLRAQLADLRAYWRGDVFGFISVKTFTRRGVVYAASEEGISGSCFGFYGRSGILAMASQVRPAFAPMIRKFAKTLNA